MFPAYNTVDLSTSGSMHDPTAQRVPGPSVQGTPPKPTTSSDLSSIVATLGTLSNSVNFLLEHYAKTNQPAAPSPTTPAVKTPLAPQLIQHIGPIPNGFSVSDGGTLISLDPRHAFPRVEASAIQQIQTLQFKPEDLYKLDHRVSMKDGDKRYVDIENSDSRVLDSSERTEKKYLTLDSIIVPLSTFFLILSVAVPTSTREPFQCAYTRYIAYLAEISARYNWSAVYKYHLEFFANRILRSQDGDWLSWAVPDLELAGRWLHGNVLPESRGASNRTSRSASSSAPASRAYRHVQREAGATSRSHGRVDKCRKCESQTVYKFSERVTIETADTPSISRLVVKHKKSLILS